MTAAMTVVTICLALALGLAVEEIRDDKLIGTVKPLRKT